MTTTKHFAFDGRVSTEDQQDPTSSRNWQLARSRQVIEAVGGEVVEEFFDIGQSRSLPWKRRPEALRLLDTFRDPSRGFDAVVIGEPQRAFYGHQFGLTFPVFVHYGIGLWVPEVGGAVDPGSEAHDLVMSLYGGMSKGERTRIKTRVRAAMAAQAAIEGRFLGGRPPYGYLLVDAGVHPNPAKAAIGQRLHALAPDPIAAPAVQRIFAEFLDGAGLHSIARGLTRDGVLSPSGHDPARNTHRASSRGVWAKTAVRAILANPRYTGRQVWNKQRKDEILIDVEDVALGHETRMRWNDRASWVWSQDQAHEALVTIETFEAVQALFGAHHQSKTRTPTAGRNYRLAGLIRCSQCGRACKANGTTTRPTTGASSPPTTPPTAMTIPRTSTSKRNPSSTASTRSSTRSSTKTSTRPPARSPGTTNPTQRSNDGRQRCETRSTIAIGASFATAAPSTKPQPTRIPRSARSSNGSPKSNANERPSNSKSADQYPATSSQSPSSERSSTRSATSWRSSPTPTKLTATSPTNNSACRSHITPTAA